MNDSTSRDNTPPLTETLAGEGLGAFDEVAEEFAERCRRGESPSITEFEMRFPEHAEKIKRLLPTVAMMEQLKRNARSEKPSEPSTPERLGEFRVIRELGRGGMGIVYEAVQESLDRHVALKVIHHVHLDVKRLQRFQRESRAIAQLHHTHIVPIFGVGEHEGLPYYVMQYIEGNGLDALLDGWRREGSPRKAHHWQFVARVGEQAAEALQYAHEQGVLHRDIKPANLLIDKNDGVWITDFGLAKLAGQDDLTASGDVVGTLRYLAPESLHGECDARSDVYSLGLTLYELLTLSPPFGEVSRSALLRQVSEGQPKQPRKLDASIPRDLETIVLKAIAREPRHRYATAGALAEDLRRYLDDRPIQARRVTTFERVWRWGRRNPATASMAAAAGVALFLAAVAGWTAYMGSVGELEREERRRGAAEIATKQAEEATKRAEAATKRAEENVALSLEVFGELFERLAGNDHLAPPPLGLSNQNMHPPNRGGGPPPQPPSRRPPPKPDGGGPGREPPPPPPREREKGAGNRERRQPGEPPGRSREEVSENDTALLESVLSFYDRFARQNAGNSKLQGEAAWAYRKVGALYDRLGRKDEAEKAYARAIAMFEDLVTRFPNVAEYRLKLVETYDMADPWSADSTELERLEQRFRRAKLLIDTLAQESPDEQGYVLDQIHMCAKLGMALQRLKRYDEAEASYHEALALEGQQLAGPSRPDRPMLDRATTQEALGVLELERGQQDAALPHLAAAADDLIALTKQDFMPPPLAKRLKSLADVYDELGESAKAEALTRLSAQARDRPQRPPPGPPGRGPRRAGGQDSR